MPPRARQVPVYRVGGLRILENRDISIVRTISRTQNLKLDFAIFYKIRFNGDFFLTSSYCQASQDGKGQISLS